jgi:DNA polymerase-4/DNA polymerase IV (DinB-like DNA polymerase)
VLLAISVERRAARTGLHGGGVTLKLTYADMKNITRSRLVISADSAAVIYQETSKLLQQVDHEPVRLIGAGVYNLTPDAGRQMVLDDFMDDAAEERQRLIERRLAEMQARYGLDFASNLEKIYTNDILHRTVEYMRKHYRR